jgi:PAS domain S-box-containing protein
MSAVGATAVWHALNQGRLVLMAISGPACNQVYNRSRHVADGTIARLQHVRRTRRALRDQLKCLCSDLRWLEHAGAFGALGAGTIDTPSDCLVWAFPMEDREETREQLLQELEESRRQVAVLQEMEAERQRAEESLRQSRDFLRSVIEGIPEVTMVIDRDYRVVLANKTAREMAGGRDPNFGCLKCHEVSHHSTIPCGGQAHPCPVAQVMETKAPLRVTHRHYDPADREVIVEVTAAPILDEHGKVIRIIVSCCDITERKKAEEALRQERDFAESLIETAHSIVLVLDVDGRIVRFNPYMENLSGYRLEEVRGKDWFATFLPQRDQTRVRAAFRRALGEFQTYGNVTPIVTKSGIERQIAWWARALRDTQGNVVGRLSIGHDITELKEAQQRLFQAERLAAIGEAMAGLAHESRNALQRSQASLELLASRVENQPDALEHINRIQKAQDHLHRLYEDVREYAAPVVLNPGVHDLGQLFQDTWDVATYPQKGRQIHLLEVGNDCDLRCEIDGFAVQQVFRNVLENALDACTDPVEIQVQYRAAEIEGRPAVQVAIRDNGPGLTPQQRQRIFDAFYTTKTHGAGLGMAIAKRVVETHGGQIAVGSGSDSGAEILITLPRSIR